MATVVFRGPGRGQLFAFGATKFMNYPKLVSQEYIDNIQEHVRREQQSRQQLQEFYREVVYQSWRDNGISQENYDKLQQVYAYTQTPFVNTKLPGGV